MKLEKWLHKKLAIKNEIELVLFMVWALFTAVFIYSLV